MREITTEVEVKLSLYGYSVQALYYTLAYKRETVPTVTYYVSKDGVVVHLGSSNTVKDFLKDLEK